MNYSIKNQNNHQAYQFLYHFLLRYHCHHYNFQSIFFIIKKSYISFALKTHLITPPILTRFIGSSKSINLPLNALMLGD